MTGFHCLSGPSSDSHTVTFETEDYPVMVHYNTSNTISYVINQNMLFKACSILNRKWSVPEDSPQPNVITMLKQGTVKY